MKKFIFMFAVIATFVACTEAKAPVNQEEVVDSVAVEETPELVDSIVTDTAEFAE